MYLSVYVPIIAMDKVYKLLFIYFMPKLIEPFQTLCLLHLSPSFDDGSYLPSGYFCNPSYLLMIMSVIVNT